MSKSEVIEQYSILQGSLVQQLLDRHNPEEEPSAEIFHSQRCWLESLSKRTEAYVKEAPDPVAATHEIISIGKAALQAFLQANVTGPPLTWQPGELVLPTPAEIGCDSPLQRLQAQLKASLSIDGEAVYHLLQYVELFALSKCLLNHTSLAQNVELSRWRLRVNTWHQRLLNDLSPTLQDLIYRDIEVLDVDAEADVLIERASIHILHGFDTRARRDLNHATEKRHFEYALTGRLGKRTKYQEKEHSQLVVLAKSADETETTGTRGSKSQDIQTSGPKALDLNDDTLLENISFAGLDVLAAELSPAHTLSVSLMSLDPGKQPQLHPLDSIILLAVASSISNTAPQDGLTREETLPYAERVITSGSPNWQVYTQALLVRSRIEGYKSRTAERGVLQLQALVDQVIAQTTAKTAPDNLSSPPMNHYETVDIFLPKANESESAPASERLMYIHQLASPPRWKLEAELADRWVSLGGLRTALEIYERLQMWAEVALCWAANDREDKARKIIRQQLYNPMTTTSTKKLLGHEEHNDISDFRFERDQLPSDAPRLFCILGDLEKSPAAYERAWEISNHRFARAQRSLGKYYLASNDLLRADEAYAKSLKINSQNHATWFALGCVRLQRETWSSAAEAFSRAIQVDDTDAESWSNLAVSLLRLSDSLGSEATHRERQKRVRDAFVALKRAATLKRESFRIWQNLLSVSLKLEPPPYTDIVLAQSRLIDLLGAAEGEKCVDIPVMEALLTDVTSTAQNLNALAINGNGDRGLERAQDKDGQRPRLGLEKMVIDLIQKKVAPLITSSRRLWLLTAKLSLHLQRPQAALLAYEKAWRSQLNKPGWDTALTTESRKFWQEVADATIDLMDAYESLGERRREAGMGEGEIVAKDWKFKARSAARSVLARAKETWESDNAYERLNVRLHALKGV